jgi:hypothetical protein
MRKYVYLVIEKHPDREIQGCFSSKKAAEEHIKKLTLLYKSEYGELLWYISCQEIED